MAACDEQDVQVKSQTGAGKSEFSGQDSRNQSVPNAARNRSVKNRRTQNVQEGRRRAPDDNGASKGDSTEGNPQRSRKNRFPRKKHLHNDDVDSSSQDESYRRRSTFNRRQGASQWNQAYRGFGGERSNRGPQKQQGNSEQGKQGKPQASREQSEPEERESGTTAAKSENERGSMSESEPLPPRKTRSKQNFQNVPYDLNLPSDSGSDSGYGRSRRRFGGNQRLQRNQWPHEGNGNMSDHQGRFSPSPYQGNFSPTPYYGGNSPIPYQGRYSPAQYQGYQNHQGRGGQFSPNPYQGHYSPTPHQNRHTPSPGYFSPSIHSFDSDSIEGLPPSGNSRSLERNGKRHTDSPRKQKKQPSKSSQRTSSSPSRARRKGSLEGIVSSSVNQMGVLIEQLTDGTYECPVCYDHVRNEAYVWSCKNCYTVFHLKCIRKWALSQAAAVEGSDGWMCPACRHEVSQIPFAYKCFCGKTRDPPFEPGEVPHSCGEVCRGKRPGSHCNHPCTILCHPGPCPSCPANVEVSCLCERTKKTVRCSTVEEFQCEEVCGEVLLCGQHYCERVCHKGNCDPCNVNLQKTCFCGKKTVTFVCGSDEVTIWGVETGFSCDVPCEKPLSCGYHNCSHVCHNDDCGTCPLTPEKVTHCPCGKTPLSDLKGNDRDKCIDPIPTCEEICSKVLGCGGADDPHTCQRTCHEGKCAPCNKTTLTKCACGHRYVDASCIDLLNSDKGYKLPSCDRKCTKRKHCGKHKCNSKCCTTPPPARGSVASVIYSTGQNKVDLSCVSVRGFPSMNVGCVSTTCTTNAPNANIDLNHICDQVCGRKLNCGVHFCDEFCHTGDCTRCLEASFEELTCHCGAQILEPPIPCGTRPPPCDYPCARHHDCDHPVRHTCHNEEQCPPCVELTSKYCFGQHELRHNLPCHLKDISCGKSCSKPLSCGAHVCQKTCHKGPCEDGGQCQQPCTVPRPDCGHPCNTRCHVGLACPMVWSYCKAKVEMKCSCGNLSETVMCMSGADDSTLNQSMQRASSAALASKTGEGVDITEMMGRRRVLECNEKCAVIERNRRLAEALHIKDAELRPDAGAPQYTEFLKEMARKNPSWVSSIEKGLSNLIQSVQDSKFPSRSHQFPCMNRDLRRMIHELAEFYGCQTQSYDQEPNKNVVATARKDKCYLPNMTLSSIVQRERFPKVPMPIPHHRNMDIRSPSPSTKLQTDYDNSGVVEKHKKIQPKEVEDFFDWTG